MGKGSREWDIFSWVMGAAEITAVRTGFGAFVGYYRSARSFTPDRWRRIFDTGWGNWRG
jgi:hypothetical protein